MTNAAIFTPISSYTTDAIVDGYIYECSCGELFNCISAAQSCRKCRNYCVFGYCTHVTDIRDNIIVAGIAPTFEEYEVARVAAEARWAEEKAELDLYIQMREEAGPLYEAEMARAAEIAAEKREEDLWELQDHMMGIK